MIITNKGNIIFFLLLFYFVGQGQKCEYELAGCLDFEPYLSQYFTTSEMVEDSNSYHWDIMFFKSIGGTDKFEFLRLTCDSNVVLSVITNDTAYKKYIQFEINNSDYNEVGNRIGICQYSSSNNTTLFWVKLDNKSFLKIATITSNLESLPFSHYDDLLNKINRLRKNIHGSR